MSDTIQNKDYSEYHNQYQKFLIYGRYFLRIPRYINRALKILRSYQNNFNVVFLKLEKPLLFLSVGIISHDMYNDYNRLKNKHQLNNKKKFLFLLDSLTWHWLASFYLPSIIISRSVFYTVVITRKFVKNQKLLKFCFFIFSVIWIYSLMKPIDHLTTFLMDNSLRKFYNFNYTELIEEDKEVIHVLTEIENNNPEIKF